jgi:hypothetical protein
VTISRRIGIANLRAIGTRLGDTMRTLRDIGEYVVRQHPEQRWDSVTRAVLRAGATRHSFTTSRRKIERTLVVKCGD